ncbi:hypothetical protein ABBQ32_000903 [Trebouxia sp. C0010 RCD-2024]
MMYYSRQAASTPSWALALWRTRDPSGDGGGRNQAMRKQRDVFDEVRTFQHQKELQVSMNDPCMLVSFYRFRCDECFVTDADHAMGDVLPEGANIQGPVPLQQQALPVVQPPLPAQPIPAEQRVAQLED